MTGSRRNRPAVRTTVMLAGALVLVASLTACARAEKPAKLGLSGSPKKSVSATAKGGTTGSPSGSAETSASGRTPAATGAGSTSGTSKSPGTTSGGTTKPASGSNTKPAATGMKVRILWWNDTAAKAPTGWRIEIASASLTPKAGVKSGSSVIGPVPVGKKIDVVVYPDGTGGKRIVVPITLTSEMEAGSERDAIHVAVSDTEVRVLGNAVDNFDLITPRF